MCPCHLLLSSFDFPRQDLLNSEPSPGISEGLREWWAALLKKRENKHRLCGHEPQQVLRSPTCGARRGAADPGKGTRVDEVGELDNVNARVDRGRRRCGGVWLGSLRDEALEEDAQAHLNARQGAGVDDARAKVICG